MPEADKSTCKSINGKHSELVKVKIYIAELNFYGEKSYICKLLYHKFLPLTNQEMHQIYHARQKISFNYTAKHNHSKKPIQTFP